VTDPIFFIGVPRSGTTILFEVFARHEGLAWLSNYSRLAPKFPVINVARRIFDNRHWRILGQKNQYGRMSFLNKLVPRPDESYEFWNAYLGDGFSREFSPHIEHDSSQVLAIRDAMKKTAGYQNRRQMSSKMTGPARIAFLTEIFPHARFVHVIRDGMSVVHSLLNVEFWRKGGGLENPWWQGVLTESDLLLWNDSDRNSAVLAALQWKRIIANARREAEQLQKGHYCEIRYEDFVVDPTAQIERILTMTQLDPSPGVNAYLRDSLDILDRGKRYLEMRPSDIESAVRAMQPLYGELGYYV
jgi:hypothetical protein